MTASNPTWMVCSKSEGGEISGRSLSLSFFLPPGRKQHVSKITPDWTSNKEHKNDIAWLKSCKAEKGNSHSNGLCYGISIENLWHHEHANNVCVREVRYAAGLNINICQTLHTFFSAREDWDDLVARFPLLRHRGQGLRAVVGWQRVFASTSTEDGTAHSDRRGRGLILRISVVTHLHKLLRV